MNAAEAAAVGSRLAVALAVVALAVLAWGACVFIETAQCEARWQPRETRWTAVAGCQVRTGGKWVNEGDVR